MADLVSTGQTTLAPEEVIVRAVQFFTSEKWRPQTQSTRIATFAGRPRIGCVLPVLTAIAFLFFIIPGVLMYFLVVRRAMQFQNLVVTADPVQSATEVTLTNVTVTHPQYARKLVTHFLSLLPPLEVEGADQPS
jgi:hypothetical protein